MVSASTKTTSPATVPPIYSGYRAPTDRPTDVMAEERPVDRAVDEDGAPQVDSRPMVDKAMVKEALADLLDEIPSFRALKAQPGTSTQNAGSSVAPPREGEPVHIRIRAKGSLSLWRLAKGMIGSPSGATLKARGGPRGPIFNCTKRGRQTTLPSNTKQSHTQGPQASIGTRRGSGGHADILRKPACTGMPRLVL